MQPIERQPRQPHMGELVIIVLPWIVRDGADGLRKQGRIPQLAASQIATPCILHDDPVSWIDDDPTSMQENLRNHMFGIAVGSQKEQAAHSQIGTPRKIQEGIRCSAADIQQLLIGERRLRIALGKPPPDRLRSRAIVSARIQFKMASTFCSTGRELGTIASENPSRYQRTEYSRWQ